MSAMPAPASDAGIAAGEVRRYILCRAEPFSESDLFEAMEERGVADHDLILDVLGELYGCGLVIYDCRGGASAGSSGWPFRTVFPRMHI